MVQLNTDELLTQARERLKELGLDAQVWSDQPPDEMSDVSVSIASGGGSRAIFAAQAKTRMTPELSTALHFSDARRTLIVAPVITDSVAERLRLRGLNYVDSVGNAHIRFDDVLVDIRGRSKRKETTRPLSVRGGKAFGPAGLKVQFALLSWPESARMTLRELASASGASLGTAKTVVDELTGAGHLIDGADGRRLVRGGELLNRWSEAYSISLSPSLQMSDLRSESMSWWSTSEAEFRQHGIQLGGEAAGSMLDDYLRPSTVTLYAAELPLTFMAAHRLRAADASNVFIRRRFWKLHQKAWLVPSTLIYADLLASGDPRQREHADRIRMQDDRLKQLDRL